MDSRSNEQADVRPGPAPGRWRFAGRELDEATACLLVDGGSQPLDHGAYAILMCLLPQAGSTVGKDELLRIGWPGRVVSENSLAKAIGRLRLQLGDADGEIVRTVHGYGYRLAVPVEWLPAPPAVTEIARTPTPTPSPRWRRHGPTLAVAAAWIALGAWFAPPAWFASPTAAHARPATSRSPAARAFADTDNPRAFDAFTDGERMRALGGPDNDRRAIAQYERAIALDPNASLPYARLADILGGDAGYADSPAQVLSGKQRSIDLMDTAISLESDRPEYYLARADFLYSTLHDWSAAQRDLDTAARLYGRRPNELLQRQCRLLAMLGRLDEAIAIERGAVASDPGSTWAWSQLGYHLAARGDYRDAHAALAVARRLTPADNHVGYYDGLASLLEHKPDEAIAAFQRSGSVFRLAGLAAARFDAGDDAGSRASLDELTTRHAPIGAYQVAQAHAWRHEPDQAFAWLERARQQQDAGLAYLKMDPLMRPLHGDPRYRRWLASLKLD